MKIDGSIIKIKQPATARDVLQGYPGHVILESVQVKRLGEQAKPLEPDTALRANKLYFVVQLPEPPPSATRSRQLSSRRVRSTINMSAKERLESLMLSRRTSSDITFVRSKGENGSSSSNNNSSGPLRIRMKLPKAQVENLVDQSRDSGEAAQRILELCVARSQERYGRAGPRTSESDKEVSGPLRQKKEVIDS